MRVATSRRIYLGLGVASVLESTVVPIPLETILIPLLQANRRRLWPLAIASVLGCIVGAILGYGAGRLVFETVGLWIVDVAGGQEQLEHAVEQVRQSGFWFVLSVGISPVPFQIAMVAAGLVGYSFRGFVVAAALSRAFRYFGVALLVQLFGDQAEHLYHTHKIAATAAAVVIVVAVWVLWYLW